jgi:acyl-coenzyme A thioesterase PaaI-like protein
MSRDTLYEIGFNPYASEEVSPASSAQWAARRKVAQAIRELTGALVTCTSGTDTLLHIALELDRHTRALLSSPQLHGVEAFALDGRHGSYGEITHELGGVAGCSNPLSPGLNMWIEGDQAFGTVTFGQAYEGPPGCVHGGYVAAIFDQFLGVAQLAAKQPGMTGTLSVRYHRPTPLHRELKLAAKVETLGGRKTRVGGEISVDGRVTASAQGLFVRPQHPPLPAGGKTGE